MCMFQPPNRPCACCTAQVFHVLDQDGDGLLSREELMVALTQRGSQPLSEEEAQTLWMEAAGAWMVG